MKLVSKILEVNPSLNNTGLKYGSRSFVPRPTLEIKHLQKEWAKIVGDGFLSKHTVPIHIEKTKLYVVTDHPSILEQAPFMKRIFQQKVDQEKKTRFFKIKSVSFILDIELFTKQKSSIEKAFLQKENGPSLHPFSPEYKSLKKRAEKEFQFVDDALIKEKLISLFIQKSSHEKRGNPK